MINKSELIEIGTLHKTHALKGELNAILNIDGNFIEEGNPIIIETDGIFVPYFASSLREKGSTSYLIKLEGIDNEDEAKHLVNKKIYALKDKLKTFLEEEGEELFDNDSFIDYSVKNFTDDTTIGKIIFVDDSTTNILLHIETPEGEIVFLPLVEEWIREINDNGKFLKMELPEGLIELNSNQKVKD